MTTPSIAVNLTSSAESALDQRDTPLYVELELYFSCLIRLRVTFPNQPGEGFIPLASDNDKLKLFFHPITTKHCNIDEIRGHDPDTETFPIKKPEKFIPKWINLDYKQNQWLGEFGYA